MKAMRGRLVSPRKRGARLYVASVTSREATQEFGGWRSPSEVERVYSEARAEKASPEIRAALGRPSDRLDTEQFLTVGGRSHFARGRRSRAGPLYVFLPAVRSFCTCFGSVGARVSGASKLKFL